MYSKQIEFKNLINSKDFFDYSKKVKFSQELAQIHQKSENTDSTPSTSDYLIAFSTRPQKFCVGYVDIINSTKISASIIPEKVSTYYEIFLNSMAKIVGMYGGRVIKNIGDCLLFYFPNSTQSSEKGMKNCLQCGTKMIEAQPIISKVIKSKKLPSLNFRISADYGSVVIMNTNTSDQIDLIGPPVNMCAKINHCAGYNEFVIGSDLVQYVKKFEEYKFHEIKSCNIGFRQSYPVYRVN
ncbi:MAG: adenylate/guanylate cyclase domain-containing protein [Nitrosopumilus sp.]|nr:adenylate/guanylate cyclase domain-containing protein [Nitrosopumilus sp.]MDH3515393.1 adenylate/guanylate cyclase domain-containing protein [Nitrosopumilus sp.]MDH3564306.1 adenylate/guanylate cyclase domain-containing protein [Nitrosopumilus sp.]MDH5417189.1 adenylate/guanylate cyclase domain-containing protein [Nitrosopumilus sp.]MDH5555024.1 adenylate/guanylate cyclase domain-containing protein [Nitrosopumilus sp.]